MSVAAMSKTPSRASHGGCFETSPRGKIGESSNAPLQPQTPTKPLVSKTGTVVAINYLNIKYLHLGVQPHLPNNAGRGGARNRSGRTSDALTMAHIAKLKAAERHARAIGLPFNRMITIHWQTAGVALAGMAKATGRFLDLLTKWLARQGHRIAWLWVHENGESKGWHCHMLVHIPAALVSRLTGLQKGWLRIITGKPYKKKVILSRSIGRRLGLEISNPKLHAANLAVAFGYVCKGAPQLVLVAHGINRQHEPGGRIIGKRSGFSQNIGAKARKSKESQ